MNSNQSAVNNLYRSQSTSNETRSQTHSNVVNEAKTILHESVYMNLMTEKQQMPHPRTLSKLKRWMRTNELNQREAARLLNISQTKLSHYLCGKSKCRGWEKLEKHMVSVMKRINEKEEDGGSESDVSEDSSESDLDSPPVSSCQESKEEYIIESNEPSYTEADDHWSKFSLNAIFYTRSNFMRFN